MQGEEGMYYVSTVVNNNAYLIDLETKKLLFQFKLLGKLRHCYEMME